METERLESMETEIEPGDHRLNALLPSSYRAKIAEEATLQITALRIIANAIGDPDDTPPEQNESYARQAEVDLAAFEKGLIRYLDLKYILSPEDYELFVKSCVRGVLTENIDLGLRAKLARLTVRLLRKRRCPATIGLPWRKVRDLIVKVHIDCADGGDFIGKDIRDAHCRNLISLLRKCRNFLEEGDGAEKIWEELGTQIDPSRALTAFEPLAIMSHVLPTRGDAWTGWLPQAANLWRMIETSCDWDSIWLGLFARVAKSQPLAVDWTPYLGLVYERIPQSFRLPLGAAAPQSPVDRRSPAHCVFLLTEKLTAASAVFCVYSLSPRSPTAFNYLKRLFALIANYFHPSNGGRWSSSLASFLGQFTCNLTFRVALEQSATRAGVLERVVSEDKKSVAPMEDRLTDDFIEEIVELVLPLVQLGLHAKSSYMSVQAATSGRDLASIAPKLVVQPMLDAAAEGLASISSPHRTSAALKMLATLTPVFLDSTICPTGIESLPQALELTLPGIDPNDPSKTEATFRFIAGSSARLQALLVDGKGQDVSLFLEDYAHQLLDRIFALLEALEAPPKKSKGGSSGAAPPVLSSFIFSVAMENFFGAVPAPVAISAAEMVARQISGAASANALKFYSILVRISASAAAVAKNSSSASIFLPILLNQIVEEDGDDTVLASLSEKELVWRIRMLAQACRTCGDVLSYANRLQTAAMLALKHPSRAVYKSGGRLLRGALEGLTAGKMRFGSGAGDDISEEEEYEIEWWAPGEAEWHAAEKLVTEALEFARGRVYSVDGKVDLSDRENIFHACRVLHAAQRGGRWLLSGAVANVYNKKYFTDKVMTKSEAKVAITRPVAAGLGGERGPEGAEVAKRLWTDTYTVIADILDTVMRERPSDSLLLYRCLEPIELAHEPFRRSNQGRMTAHAAHGYKAAYKPVMAVKRRFGAVGGAGRIMPRFIMKLRVEALHELRLGLSARGGQPCEDLSNRILQSLVRMSTNDFAKVRGEARGVLTRTLRIAPPAVRKQEISRLIDVLQASSVAKNSENKSDQYDYEKMIGAADVLRSSVASPYIVREWSLYKKVAVAALKAMLAAERPDAASVVGGLYAKLASLIRPIGIEPLKLVNMSLEGYTERTEGAKIPTLADLNGLNDSLVALVNRDDNGISESESRPMWETHWRLQSLVATTLYTNIRESCAPTISVAAFFAESMTSEVVALRQASKKAIALIVALQHRKTDKTSADHAALDTIEKVVLREGYTEKLLHTLALDEAMDTSDNSSGVADGSLGVFSLLALAKHIDGDACWALVGGRPWPASWVPRSRDTLIITRVRLIEGLFRTYGSPLLKAFADPLENLLRSEDGIPGVTKENVRVLVAEVVAGIARGLPGPDENLPRSANAEDVRTILSWVKDLLEVFNGHEGMVNGCTFLRLLASGEEDRVARTVAGTIRSEIFLPPLVDMSAPAHVQAKQLRYLHSCIADENPSTTDVPVEQVIPLLMVPELLSHQLKHVREEIARCLSLLSSFTTRNAPDVYMKCVQDFVEARQEKAHQELGEEERKSRSQEGDTLSRWVSVVHWNGDTHIFGRYLVVLLPVLFACLDDSDPERAKLPESRIDSVIEICKETVKSQRWRIRGAVLPFLQVLAFTRLFAMDEDRLSRIREIVIGLLGDEQLEVREAATHTLVPFIRDAPDEAITQTRSLFYSRLDKTRNVMRKQRRNPTTALNPQVVLERHSAVLGLSSMVMSSPYSVPSWMPQALVALTTCIDDPPPISTSARKLFTEFWRTHRDEWHNLKQNFNEDELETVSELLISPSYYA